MYICICKGITEKQVQDAVSRRASNNPKEILKSLGVGSDCGTCIEDAVKSCLEKRGQSRNEKNQPSSKK